jgi:hypothetical protein
LAKKKWKKKSKGNEEGNEEKEEEKSVILNKSVNIFNANKLTSKKLDIPK